MLVEIEGYHTIVAHVEVREALGGALDVLGGHALEELDVFLVVEPDLRREIEFIDWPIPWCFCFSR